MMAVLTPAMFCSLNGFSAVTRRFVPKVRMKKPYTPCMQPMDVSRNKMTNSPSSTVRDALQPVRQSRSANSIETAPVNSTAEEKNRNSRAPRRSRGAETAVMLGASAIYSNHDFTCSKPPCVSQKTAMSSSAKNPHASAMRT